MSTQTDAPTAYFVRTPGGFRATSLTSGAWSVTEQHIAPITGLLVHEVERTGAADGMVVGRVTLDILGVVGVEEFGVDVKVVRPGHTISLVEATATWRGRAVATARVWRLLPSDTSEIAGGEHAPVPGPEDLPRWDMTAVWPGDFIGSLEVRQDPRSRPGRSTTWVRTGVDLVQGEQVSDLARWMGLLDTANGIAVRQSPQEWLYPNLDLTIHLHRQPRGPWVGFENRVHFGADGIGLTDSVLHDVDGPVGRSAQVLTIRRRTR